MLATNEELRSVARRIRTRGLAKALRVLGETRALNRILSKTALRADCPFCDAYEGNDFMTLCGQCPMDFELGEKGIICDRAVRVRGVRRRAAGVVDVCTRLARFVRAEIKRREA